jgi:hypothetical protein
MPKIRFSNAGNVIVKGTQVVPDYFKISDEDFDLNSYKWRANWQYTSRAFYAVRDRRKSEPAGPCKIHIHDVILKRMLPNTTLTADHIDRNTLNNLRSNLREATASQQSYNQGLRVDNTSGYKGVSWNKRVKRWIVHVGDGSVTGNYIGCFKTIEEAVEARDKAIIDRGLIDWIPGAKP